MDAFCSQMFVKCKISFLLRLLYFVNAVLVRFQEISALYQDYSSLNFIKGRMDCCDLSALFYRPSIKSMGGMDKVQ